MKIQKNHENNVKRIPEKSLYSLEHPQKFIIVLIKVLPKIFNTPLQGGKDLPAHTLILVRNLVRKGLWQHP